MYLSLCSPEVAWSNSLLAYRCPYPPTRSRTPSPVQQRPPSSSNVLALALDVFRAGSRRPPPRSSSNPLPWPEGMRLGNDRNHIQLGFSESLHFGFERPPDDDDDCFDARYGMSELDSYAQVVRSGVLMSVPSSSTLTACGDGFDMHVHADSRAHSVAPAAAAGDNDRAFLEVVRPLDGEAKCRRRSIAKEGRATKHVGPQGASGWHARHNTLGDFVVAPLHKRHLSSHAPRTAHSLFVSTSSNSSSPTRAGPSRASANSSAIGPMLLHSHSRQASSPNATSTVAVHSSNSNSRMCPPLTLEPRFEQQNTGLSPHAADDSRTASSMTRFSNRFPFNSLLCTRKCFLLFTSFSNSTAY